MKIKLELLFFLSLCNIICVAQGTISIHLKDENNKPIPFYSVEQIKYKEIKFLGDSLGKVKIPNTFGIAYNLHAVGYADTIITIQEQQDLSFILRSNNLLKEVVIKGAVFSSKIKELNASRINQVYWSSHSPNLNHEIGRIVNFDKNIWLQKATFKLKSFYKIDFKKFVNVNIYKVNEKLEDDLIDLKTKKIWTYVVSTPELIFSSHLTDNYDVSFEKNYLTFDLSRLNWYLDNGKYIITMELMAGSTMGVKPAFSLQNECLTIRSNSNTKRVAWSTDLGFGSKKYPNLIADFTFREQVEN